MIGRCDWLEDEDGNWETSCGECFHFEIGTPKDNKHMFCGFCGGRLIEHKHSEREEVKP